MRKPSCAVVVLALSGLAFAGIEPQSAAVPERTEVEIELVDAVSSESLHAGQVVAFKTVRPVVVNGATVIAEGTPVAGEVKTVQSSGAWHKAGSIDLTLKPVQLADGRAVQLDFHRPKLVKTGKERTGNAVAAALVLTYYFPLIPAALVQGVKKGAPFNIKAGERYLVYVMSTTSSPVAEPRKTTPQPR